MRLTVLVDNNAMPGLKSAWGLSILVEHDNGTKVLFDADTDPSVLAYNVERLGVKLDDVDFAVLSHPHRDHYGGFEYVARVAESLKLYMPAGAENVRRHLERLGFKVVEVENDIVFNGFVIVGPFEGLYKSFTIPEIALAVTRGREAVVLVGCSHPGVDVIVERIVKLGYKIRLVIGGFHEPGVDVIERLVGMVEGRICPIHCSGSARDYIREKHSDKYCEAYAGTVITI